MKLDPPTISIFIQKKGRVRWKGKPKTAKANMFKIRKPLRPKLLSAKPQTAKADMFKIRKPLSPNPLSPNIHDTPPQKKTGLAKC